MTVMGIILFRQLREQSCKHYYMQLLTALSVCVSAWGAVMSCGRVSAACMCVCRGGAFSKVYILVPGIFMVVIRLTNIFVGGLYPAVVGPTI